MKTEHRTSTLIVRLTPKEKERLCDAAWQKQVSVSEYVRTNIAFPPPVTKKEYDNLKLNLIYEIRKIGVNINQIAKKYNEYRLTEASEELTDRMDKVQELVKQVVSSILEKEK